MSVPLPQDRAWDPTKNPYDRCAYERICNNFDIPLDTDWHVRGANYGLRRVYFYTAGGHLPAYGAVDSDHYNPATMSFTTETNPRLNCPCRLHQARTAGGGGADEAWRQFILDKSQGFTWAGVERLNDSIWTYVWALLGAPGTDADGDTRHRYSL